MTREGGLYSEGLETYYRVLGDLGGQLAGKLPVLALHGGPGLPHEGLEPLRALSRGCRPVVVYDQVGCGNSARLGEPERFVAAVEGFLARVEGRTGP